MIEFLLTLGSVLFLEHDGNFLLVSTDEGLSDGFETARALIVSVALMAIAVVIGAPLARRVAAAAAGDAAERGGDRRPAAFAVAQQAAPIWLRWLAMLSLLPDPGRLSRRRC